MLSEYGLNIPWWIISAIALVLMLLLSYEGITGSLRTALILFSAEVIVILVLSTIILIKGGRDGPPSSCSTRQIRRTDCRASCSVWCSAF